MAVGKWVVGGRGFSTCGFLCLVSTTSSMSRHRDIRNLDYDAGESANGRCMFTSNTVASRLGWFASARPN